MVGRRHAGNARRGLGQADLAVLAAHFEAAAPSRKARATRALGVVNAWHALREKGYTKSAADQAVSYQFNISVATIARWLADVSGAPSHAWLYLLLDEYAGRTALADMSAEAWETLKADYLRAERPTAKACVFRLKRAAAAAGWTLPSVRTMERRLQAIPRVVRVLAREGKKAALQLYPSQARSRAALSALEIVNADGYEHNVWVRFPDGEICRPKTWCWQDVYSSKALAWRTDKTEHTDVIRLSLGDVIERYGIPERALLDNTMAAANKTMSGGSRRRFRFKVREEEPWGVFKLLGMQDPIWAAPRHGQSKPIERIFGIGGLGELIDKHPALAGAWTGSGRGDKPEYAEGLRGKNRVIELEAFEQLLASEMAAFNAKPGRRSVMHAGRSFDEVFAESYGRIVPRRATEAQRRLWLLATEPVTAGRKDGAITLDAGRISRTNGAPMQANRYWAPEMTDLAGHQVVARFDPRRLHEGVHVYTLDGRYIAFAECFEAQGFNDQVAGREFNRARRGFVKGARLQLRSETRMDALQASKFLSGAERPSVAAADATIPAPKVVRAAFRDPLERPRFDPSAAPRALDATEQSFMAEAEAAAAAPLQANVAELRTDPAKHDYWLALDARRAGGEALADADEHFWKAWQQSAFFTIQRDLDQEFEQRRATGG